jgi:hypothetical protein
LVKVGLIRLFAYDIEKLRYPINYFKSDIGFFQLLKICFYYRKRSFNPIEKLYQKKYQYSVCPKKLFFKIS